jgi:hypothetical protein
VHTNMILICYSNNQWKDWSRTCAVLMLSTPMFFLSHIEKILVNGYVVMFWISFTGEHFSSFASSTVWTITMARTNGSISALVDDNYINKSNENSCKNDFFYIHLFHSEVNYFYLIDRQLILKTHLHVYIDIFVVLPWVSI